jgi:hypothetical protein
MELGGGNVEKELTGILGIPEAVNVGGIMRRRRNFTAAVRAKMSAAAKAKWEKRRAAKK